MMRGALRLMTRRVCQPGRKFSTNAPMTQAIADENPMIMPVWWNGTPSMPVESYGVDCSEYDMTKDPWDLPEVVDQMNRVFYDTGLCYLHNTRLTDYENMSKWAGVLVTYGDYQGGANSRNSVANNVFDTGAPKEAHLHYHHEMAYMQKSVQLLAFCALNAVAGKGEMFVSNNLKATDLILATEMGQKLKEKGICYVRCLTDRNAWDGLSQHGIYNHWQRSFGVETPEEVEFAATQRGLQIEWGQDNFLKTKCYISGFEYFPQMERNLLYSSVADDAIWFDTWPGVCDLPRMPSYDQVTAAHRPLKITYGDDSEFTYEELKLFVDVYDACAIPIPWKVGDVLTVCNYRWAHGRPAYDLEGDEKRNLGVVLGGMYPRIGQIDDVW